MKHYAVCQNPSYDFIQSRMRGFDINTVNVFDKGTNRQ